MNPLLITSEESFRAGTDSLSYFRDRLLKMPNGVLLFCLSGEADVTIDLETYHVIQDTTIVVLPKSIFAVKQMSSDFRVHYFAYSDAMFDLCCFRLPPAYLHFLKENSCHLHDTPESLAAVKGLVEASNFMYTDKEHCFRETIAQNLLQIFFLDVYDKAQRFFTREQTEGSSRKEELFKKFINLAHTHCVNQRDVTFYARQLCISTRYLSAITQQMGKESAKEIIDKFLILELKVTLQGTDLSLKEIADKFHFPDQSFFGRYFKKHTGMSPKAFRAKKGRRN